MHGMKLIGRAWASARLIGDAAAARGNLSAENPDVSALRPNRETKLCFLTQRRAFSYSENVAENWRPFGAVPGESGPTCLLKSVRWVLGWMKPGVGSFLRTQESSDEHRGCPQLLKISDLRSQGQTEYRD